MLNIQFEFTIQISLSLPLNTYTKLLSTRFYLHRWPELSEHKIQNSGVDLENYVDKGGSRHEYSNTIEITLSFISVIILHSIAT